MIFLSRPKTNNPWKKERWKRWRTFGSTKSYIIAIGCFVRAYLFRRKYTWRVELTQESPIFLASQREDTLWTNCVQAIPNDIMFQLLISLLVCDHLLHVMHSSVFSWYYCLLLANCVISIYDEMKFNITITYLHFIIYDYILYPLAKNNTKFLYIHWCI